MITAFGGASHTGHCVHVPEWAECLVDNEVTRRIMAHIFNSDNYICRGGGGDFCLAGSVEYQGLHQDMGDPVGNADVSETPAVGIHFQHFDRQKFPLLFCVLLLVLCCKMMNVDRHPRRPAARLHLQLRHAGFDANQRTDPPGSGHTQAPRRRRALQRSVHRRGARLDEVLDRARPRGFGRDA